MVTIAALYGQRIHCLLAHNPLLPRGSKWPKGSVERLARISKRECVLGQETSPVLLATSLIASQREGEIETAQSSSTEKRPPFLRRAVRMQPGGRGEAEAARGSQIGISDVDGRLLGDIVI